MHLYSACAHLEPMVSRVCSANSHKLHKYTKKFADSNSPIKKSPSRGDAHSRERQMSAKADHARRGKSVLLERKWNCEGVRSTLLFVYLEAGAGFLPETGEIWLTGLLFPSVFVMIRQVWR